MLHPVFHSEAGKTSKNLAGLWFKSSVFLKSFLWLSCVVASTGPGGFMIMCVCVYFMTGAPKGSTEG